MDDIKNYVDAPYPGYLFGRPAEKWTADDIVGMRVKVLGCQRELEQRSNSIRLINDVRQTGDALMAEVPKRVAAARLERMKKEAEREVRLESQAKQADEAIREQERLEKEARDARREKTQQAELVAQKDMQSRRAALQRQADDDGKATKQAVQLAQKEAADLAVAQKEADESHAARMRAEEQLNKIRDSRNKRAGQSPPQSGEKVPKATALVRNADEPLIGKEIETGENGAPFCTDKGQLQEYIIALVKHDEKWRDSLDTCVFVKNGLKVAIIEEDPGTDIGHVVKARVFGPDISLVAYTLSLGLVAK